MDAVDGPASLLCGRRLRADDRHVQERALLPQVVVAEHAGSTHRRHDHPPIATGTVENPCCHGDHSQKA